MSKLDDILVPTKEVRQSRTYKEIKQQIRDLIIELIGDDDYLSTSSSMMTHWQKVGSNDLKAKLRKKAEKL